MQSVTLEVTYPIVVTLLEWTNPPERKRREWGRLAAAILAHEQHHVTIIQTLLRQMSQTYVLDGRTIGETKLPHAHVHVIVCPEDKHPLETHVEIVKDLKKQAADHAMRVYGILNDILNRAVVTRGDEFHQTQAGRPIDVKDYITP